MNSYKMGDYVIIWVPAWGTLGENSYTGIVQRTNEYISQRTYSIRITTAPLNAASQETIGKVFEQHVDTIYGVMADPNDILKEIL